MTKIQDELRVLLEKDGWKIFQSYSKGNMVIMQKKIEGIIFYISIKKDGAVHFNRSKV